MAHWREAVDVYEHDGSMLDLDNIVRLETVLGDRIGYDAYHRINYLDERVRELERLVAGMPQPDTDRPSNDGEGE